MTDDKKPNRKKLGRPAGRRRSSLSVTLPIPMLKQARKAANKSGLSLSAYIERAIHGLYAAQQEEES
jgi:hypothetical protein